MSRKNVVRTINQCTMVNCGYMATTNDAKSARATPWIILRIVWCMEDERSFHPTMHQFIMLYGFSCGLIERAHLIFPFLYSVSFMKKSILDMDLIYTSLKLSTPFE